MLFHRYASLILCVLISSSAHSGNEDRYTRNIREDRCVHVSMLVGAVLTVALVTPGAYILTPRGAYNMQPSCPQGSPIQCCDKKTAGQNVTTSPANCTLLSGGTVNCADPSVAYCFGATVPAGLEYQEWAKATGGALLGVGLAGFIYGVGAFIQGCCWGTFFCG